MTPATASALKSLILNATFAMLSTPCDAADNAVLASLLTTVKGKRIILKFKVIAAQKTFPAVLNTVLGITTGRWNIFLNMELMSSDPCTENDPPLLPEPKANLFT